MQKVREDGMKRGFGKSEEICKYMKEDFKGIVHIPVWCDRYEIYCNTYFYPNRCGECKKRFLFGGKNE